MIVDLGCGDGRATLALAAGSPGSLVLGVDPVASAMAESSRRAARAVRKGGLPNALFLEASAEGFAAVLPAVADVVVVNFPWGSLLRGVLGLDEVVAGAVAALVRDGGSVSALVSVAPRDGVGEVPCLDAAAVAAVAERWACHGLRLVGARVASRSEVAATRSTWARRLGVGREADREVWRLEFRRDNGSVPEP